MTESEIIQVFSKKEKQWLKLTLLGAFLILVAIYIFNKQIYMALAVGAIILGLIIVSFATIILYNCPKCHGIISQGHGIVIWPSKCPKCNVKLR
ncbi:MAG: hypothetical protein ACC651_10030 [Candidatus Scalindua sp.]